eukprot:augustus_masked-scaffold_6-processed-gene-3.7-mRNA-1 protein AED:0.48 eAED:0.48 QI:0/-1/0/1/-1/1/1/0/1466
MYTRHRKFLKPQQGNQSPPRPPRAPRPFHNRFLPHPTTYQQFRYTGNNQRRSMIGRNHHRSNQNHVQFPDSNTHQNEGRKITLPPPSYTRRYEPARPPYRIDYQTSNSEYEQPSYTRYTPGLSYRPPRYTSAGLEENLRMSMSPGAGPGYSLPRNQRSYTLPPQRLAVRDDSVPMERRTGRSRFSSVPDLGRRSTMDLEERSGKSVDGSRNRSFSRNSSDFGESQPEQTQKSNIRSGEDEEGSKHQVEEKEEKKERTVEELFGASESSDVSQVSGDEDLKANDSDDEEDKEGRLSRAASSQLGWGKGLSIKSDEEMRDDGSDEEEEKEERLSRTATSQLGWGKGLSTKSVSLKVEEAEMGSSQVEDTHQGKNTDTVKTGKSEGFNEEEMKMMDAESYSFDKSKAQTYFYKLLKQLERREENGPKDLPEIWRLVRGRLGAEIPDEFFRICIRERFQNKPYKHEKPKEGTQAEHDQHTEKISEIERETTFLSQVAEMPSGKDDPRDISGKEVFVKEIERKRDDTVNGNKAVEEVEMEEIESEMEIATPLVDSSKYVQAYDESEVAEEKLQKVNKEVNVESPVTEKLEQKSGNLPKPFGEKEEHVSSEVQRVHEEKNPLESKKDSSQENSEAKANSQHEEESEVVPHNRLVSSKKAKYKLPVPKRDLLKRLELINKLIEEEKFSDTKHVNLSRLRSSITNETLKKEIKQEVIKINKSHFIPVEEQLTPSERQEINTILVKKLNSRNLSLKKLYADSYKMQRSASKDKLMNAFENPKGKGRRRRMRTDKLSPGLDLGDAKDELHNAERRAMNGAVVPAFNPIEADLEGFSMRSMKLCCENLLKTSIFTFPKETENKIPGVSKMFSDLEKVMFIEIFLMYPKDFKKIASYFRNKTVFELIDFYYKTKKTVNYKELLHKQFHLRKENVQDATQLVVVGAKRLGIPLSADLLNSNEYLSDLETKCTPIPSFLSIEKKKKKDPSLSIQRNAEFGNTSILQVQRCFTTKAKETHATSKRGQKRRAAGNMMGYASLVLLQDEDGKQTKPPTKRGRRKASEKIKDKPVQLETPDQTPLAGVTGPETPEVQLVSVQQPASNGIRESELIEQFERTLYTLRMSTIAKISAAWSTLGAQAEVLGTQASSQKIHELEKTFLLELKKSRDTELVECVTKIDAQQVNKQDTEEQRAVVEGMAKKLREIMVATDLTDLNVMQIRTSQLNRLNPHLGKQTVGGGLVMENPPASYNLQTQQHQELNLKQEKNNSRANTPVRVNTNDQPVNLQSLASVQQHAPANLGNFVSGNTNMLNLSPNMRATTPTMLSDPAALQQLAALSSSIGGSFGFQNQNVASTNLLGLNLQGGLGLSMDAAVQLRLLQQHQQQQQQALLLNNLSQNLQNTGTMSQLRSFPGMNINASPNVNQMNSLNNVAQLNELNQYLTAMKMANMTSGDPSNQVDLNNLQYLIQQSQNQQNRHSQNP